MSDRYGLILVKDLDKFRKTQLNDKGEPLHFINYAVNRPYGLKEDFKDNVVFTPFNIRTDDCNIRLRNIINSGKKLNEDNRLPRVVKLKTIKNFILEQYTYWNGVISQMQEQDFVYNVISRFVEESSKTLTLIEEKGNEFSYALIGIF